MNKVVIWYVLGTVALLAGIVFLSTKNNPPAPGEAVDPNLVRITEQDHIKGNERSSVTLIEYSDFQCPACSAYYPLVKNLVQDYESQIRFVYRHFPLNSIHENAEAAARATEAAALQGKFWEMHDILFEKQPEWDTDPNVKQFFQQYAEELGLDTEKFMKDFGSIAVAAKVQNDLKSAEQLGLTGTPSFLLNGEKIENPRDATSFAARIEDALSKTSAPEINEDDLSAAEDIHMHADFSVYLNGVQQTYTDATQESTNPFVRLLEDNTNIIHVNKRGVTLGYFFKSIGMELTSDCLVTRNGEQFCTDDTNSLKFFVNGKRNTRYGDYVINDLDQLLISYGPLADTTIKTQLAAVLDRACVYSETCPDRGNGEHSHDQ